MTPEPATYPRHRFPVDVISHEVWSAGHRVDPGRARRGGNARERPPLCRKFGANFAGRLHRRRPQPGDTWHLDEVFIGIRGVLHYLWRAVDQHGIVLDILVQERRNGAAAKRCFKRPPHWLRYKPRRLVNAGLRNYGVAQRAVLSGIRHRTSRYLDNRAENSHRPTRRRERKMQRFTSPQRARGFLSAHSLIYGHFWPRRHLMAAAGYRHALAKAFRIWRQETLPP